MKFTRCLFTFSLSLSLQLNIRAVNDAPVLSYVSGGSVEIYSYIEDDPAINIGENIILEDVDSPITSVSLYLTSEYIYASISMQSGNLMLKYPSTNSSL